MLWVLLFIFYQISSTLFEYFLPVNYSKIFIQIFFLHSISKFNFFSSLFLFTYIFDLLFLFKVKERLNRKILLQVFLTYKHQWRLPASMSGVRNTSIQIYSILYISPNPAPLLHNVRKHNTDVIYVGNDDNALYKHKIQIFMN